MELLLGNAWAIFGLVLSLLLLCLVPVMIELWRTVRDVRMVADRIEKLTDVFGWFEFFSGNWHKWRRKKSDR
jgi:hypothetical protein